MGRMPLSQSIRLLAFLGNKGLDHKGTGTENLMVTWLVKAYVYNCVFVCENVQFLLYKQYC